MPSGAPNVTRLQEHFEKRFQVSASQYNLAEQTAIIEHQTKDRAELITQLRSQFKGLTPTGALLNLPLYKWKSIYTTNYDELIEASYLRRDANIAAYSCNFDFGIRHAADAVQLFKLHGTIGKDVAFGDKSRIILTDTDYDLADEYRETLFDRLKSDLAGSHLIIIGHSLADPDIKSIVTRAVALNSKSGAGGKITLFLFQRDDGRASLFESRGVEVCFGGIDDFFSGLITKTIPGAIKTANADPLDIYASLRPATTDAAHSIQMIPPDVSSMYNGWPASYADIEAGLTFRRTVSDDIELQLDADDLSVAVLLGPSGVGKTTAARQVVAGLLEKGFFGWEHKLDQPLLAQQWREVSRYLTAQNAKGVLLIDDAHSDFAELNTLIDYLSADSQNALKLLLISTNNQWRPRVKTPALFRVAKEYSMSRISGNEIEKLLTLVDTNAQIRPLVEQSFAGFSRSERRRRLIQRCDADMFVCMKNIFSSEKFDDIILREYAGLEPASQEVYRSLQQWKTLVYTFTDSS